MRPDEAALVRPYMLRSPAEQAAENRRRRARRQAPDPGLLGRVLDGLHALPAEPDPWPEITELARRARRELPGVWGAPEDIVPTDLRTTQPLAVVAA